jgi:hypothetical protein
VKTIPQAMPKRNSKLSSNSVSALRQLGNDETKLCGMEPMFQILPGKPGPKSADIVLSLCPNIVLLASY